jgi:hypothetical protein
MNAEKTLTNINAVAAHLSSLSIAVANCVKGGMEDWEEKHRDSIAQIVADHLPRGSGWDHGTTFDIDASSTNRLVFSGSFHHMDEHGGYDGWTDHKIIITPTFDGVDVDVKGRNRNGIKTMLGEDFYWCLTKKIGWDADANRYVRA